MLLISAAGLKLYGANYSPVPPMGVLSTPTVQNAVAVGELALGLWLISGRFYTASWLLAAITFLVFAAVSGSLGLKGVANCGCFGAIEASPWWAFGVDLIALGFLVVARPRSNLRREWAEAGGAIVRAVAVTVSITLLWDTFRLSEVFDRLVLGRTIRVQSEVEFEGVSPGADYSNSLHVWNDGPTLVTVVGAASTCSCLVSEVPVRIPPGECREVRVRLRVPQQARGERTYRGMELWTDSGRQPRLRFVVSYRVRADD